MAKWHEFNKMKERFWDYLIKDYRTNHPNVADDDLEALAFARALELAFSGGIGATRHFLSVERDLVLYLGAFLRDLYTYGISKKKVVGPEPEANHFLRRSYDAFFHTIREAIKSDDIYNKRDDGNEEGSVYMIGCLDLPDWLVEAYQQEAAQHRAHVRKINQEEGTSLYVV